MSALCLSELARASTDVWTNQAGTGNWSASPSDDNWSILGVQGPYTDGDNVIFDDSAGIANTSVNLVGTLNPGSITVAGPTLNYTLLGSGVIDSGSLTKSGAGALALDGSNQNLYSGNTTVLAGTLDVDLGNLGAAGNLIYPGSSLLMDGGSLNVVSGSTSSIQGFGGTILQAGGSSIAVGGTATSVINLNSLSRVQGATVNFSIPGSDQILTANSNAYGTGPSAILGGYATVNWTDWATVSSGDIVALSPSGYTANSWAPGVNTDVTASFGPVTGTTQSLRFNNTPGNTVLTLGSGAIIGSGGILVTSNVATPGSLIEGGTLTSGDSENDLVVNDYDTLANFGLWSTIVNNGANATGLTKSGPGTVTTINSMNTYSGPTTIDGGVFAVRTLSDAGSPSTLGASSNAANNLLLNGGTLEFYGNPTGVTDRAFTLGPKGGRLMVPVLLHPWNLTTVPPTLLSPTMPQQH